METCKIIRDLREDNGYSQQQIADILDIKRTMYQKYEYGETELPMRHAKALAKLYKVSLDYIAGLTK